MSEAVPQLSSQNLPTKAMNLDDLHEVLQMYNEVTNRLEVSHERLQAEVGRLREQLEQKNKELEQKKRLAALGEMAAGIAHEIRNPLGGIQLYASSLAAEVADRPAAALLVQKISKGVKGLNAMVTDMLTFTQNIQLAKQRTDLADLMTAVVDLAMPTLLEHNIDVRLSDSIEEVSVQADPKMLRQVLLNLVLNAAEAIAEQKKKNAPPVIAINAVQDKNGVTITIDDNGPGISEGNLEKIFNPFFTTKHTGTGLGLAIVHRIIEAHGGTIVAQNRPQGGARFEIKLESKN